MSASFLAACGLRAVDASTRRDEAAACSLADALAVTSTRTLFVGGLPLDAVEVAEIVDGLRLTLYFLDRHLFSGAGQPVPPLRIALADRLARRSGRGPSSADGTNPMEIR